MFALFQKYPQLTKTVLVLAAFGLSIPMLLFNYMSWFTLSPATAPLSPHLVDHAAELAAIIWIAISYRLGTWLLLKQPIIKHPRLLFLPTFILCSVFVISQLLLLATLAIRSYRAMLLGQALGLLWIYLIINSICLAMIVVTALFKNKFPPSKPNDKSKRQASEPHNASGQLFASLKRFLLLDFIAGLGLTAKTFFRPKVTIQFPDEQMPVSPRFRGLLALRRYDNGEERCIACRLCEAVCPALAITIEAEPREDGSRRTTRFDLDMFKCINCGLCAEACPVDSIVTTNQHHYVVRERGENILTKEKLLAIGDYCSAQLKNDLAEEKRYR